MKSKTLFHSAKMYSVNYKYADAKLTEIFENIRYRYSKKYMEMFF